MNKTELKSTKLHSSEIVSIRQIPGTMKCISSSTNGEIRVWDCLDSSVALKSYTTRGAIQQMIYLEEFSQIVTIEDQNLVKVYELNSDSSHIQMKEVKEVTLSSNLVSLAKSTGSLVVTSDESGSLTSNIEISLRKKLSLRAK